jgi:hypothetical protein
VAQDLTEEVQRFIARYITSVEQLEVLLLLFSEPSRSWTPEAVYGQIQSHPGSVHQRLDDLVLSGFLIKEPATSTYRYSPADGERAQAVPLLAKAYRERRVKVIELIFAKPIDQVKAFADAFKLRKDKPDG